MKYTSIPVAQTVIAYCRAAGIRDIVISPGSRNAPLTLGFTEDPYFECYSIIDERSAGFFALGLMQRSGRPAALVCTSGSAVLNYYPAVAEAFYSDLPLVVLTADRPAYKIDIGDGQTIRQDQVLARHTEYSASLLQDPSHATETFRQFSPGRFTTEPVATLQERVQAFNERELQLALKTAFVKQGPVHLNIPLEEPLYQLRDAPVVNVQPAPVTEFPMPELPELQPLLAAWERAERVMVLVGVLPPGSLEAELVDWLGSQTGVLVFTETTSNLEQPEFFPSIDSIIAPLEKQEGAAELFDALRPDLLITFGGMIVSKKVKAFLRNHPPEQHWHIDLKKAYDTFFCLSRHLKTTPSKFFFALREQVALKQGPYRLRWSEARQTYKTRRDTYLSKIPFSDFKAFSMLCKALPETLILHLANSSTVRYAQLFDLPKGAEVYANRGTSGIEGSTSTAVGAALKATLPTVLVTGDLSFLYDSNGLWNRYLRKDFRIVVINNQGGGIFRILPGVDSTPNFGTYFETVQDTPLAPLCEAFGLEYSCARGTDELEQQLSNFFESSEKPRLLELRTPRLENNKILLQYFEFLS